MNVIRYEPASMFRHFHDQVNRVVHDDYGLSHDAHGKLHDQVSAGSGTSLSRRGWSPAVDVMEEDERYVITADVPGVDPKEIEITMEAGVLTIKADRSTAAEQGTDACTRNERAHGEFQRRFSLPKGADADGIAASCAHGVLSVSIPKKPEPQPRRIQVQ